MTALAFVGAVVVALGLVLWAGNRMLRDNDGPSAGGGNAFGGFEVFDPGQARGREELDSKRHEAQQLPTPGDDDHPVRVDLSAGTFQVKKPKP